MESCSIMQAPYISKFLFISVTFLSCRFLRISKRSSLQRLKLCFINDFIDQIGLVWFTILNFIHVYKSVFDVVYFKGVVHNGQLMSLILVRFCEDIGHQRNDHPFFLSISAMFYLYK